MALEYYDNWNNAHQIRRQNSSFNLSGPDVPKVQAISNSKTGIMSKSEKKLKNRASKTVEDVLSKGQKYMNVFGNQNEEFQTAELETVTRDPNAPDRYNVDAAAADLIKTFKGSTGKANTFFEGSSSGPTNVIDDVVLALAKVESDNGQNLNHKEVTNPNSMYFGQKAIGTWAIMPGNIDPTMNTSGSRNSRDSWLNFAAFKEQFPEITPDAKGVELFKNNKAAQELVVRNQVQKNYNKTQSEEDVAAIWFTGGPVTEKTRKLKDDTGTDLNKYLKKFNHAITFTGAEDVGR
tara:strand:- start:553 stop:1428 length:876 start_codon:yes stop_codon:yes gene_type:complete